MIVIDKSDYRYYQVFNVKDDKNGYPQFLIHKENEWKYISAKEFIPLPIEIDKAPNHDEMM